MSSKLYAEANIEMRFQLHPVGSFVASSSRIKGHALMDKGQLRSSGIYLDVTSLKTGISLRDRYLWHQLRYEKFPVAALENISTHLEQAPGIGVGKGTLRVRGVNKRIFFDYKFVSTEEIEAKFKLNLRDFGNFNLVYHGVKVKDEIEVRVLIPVRHFIRNEDEF